MRVDEDVLDAETVAPGRTSTAAFTTDLRLRILTWDDSSEALTGVPAPEAVGRPCWEVVRARDGDGAPVCGPDCGVVRAVVDGWTVSREVVGAFRSRSTTLTLSSAALRSSPTHPTILHRMEPSGLPNDRAPLCSARLTPRQIEILSLLAEGVRVQEIAHKLVLAPATVRNHVRAVLVELGVHSQLEAVARGRALGLVGDHLPERGV